MTKLPDFLGPYRLGRFIRSGNSTVIHEAIKDGANGRCVLKILRSNHWGDREEIGYLKHEFEVAHGLSHPNVIKIMEFRSEGKIAFLVLEQFSVHNIKQVMRDQGMNPIWVEFPRIVEQCAGGLQCLHEKGWVHCDIKPDNFLLSESSEVKLIDFTISQRAVRGKLSAMFRKKGQVRGTRSYMSPEQIRNEALDARSDIYSFGCLLFELLSGKVPYTGTSPNDLLNRHLTAPVPNVQVHNDNITPEMAELVRKMIAKKPEDRPASMMEVLKEFRGVRPFKMAPKLDNPPESAGEDQE